MSPALAGGFLTSAPPGKPPEKNFLRINAFYVWFKKSFPTPRSKRYLPIFSYKNFKVSFLTFKLLFAGDFPGGPVVKTPRLQCRGAWARSLVGELRSHMPGGVAK